MENIRENLVYPNNSTSIPDRRTSAYELLVQRLSEMGFDSRTIESAINSTGASTVEEALDYLIKTPSGWVHSFIPSDEDGSECIICQETEDQHSEILGRELQLPQMLISSPNFFTPPENPCMICYEEIDNAWSHPMCWAHRFCFKCICNYLSFRISESQVSCIRCPGSECELEFSDELIESIVSRPLYEKYLRFKRRAEILKDPDMRWCRTPNCEGYMKGSPDNPKLTCPLCSCEICFKCGEIWHLRSCEEAVDKAYEHWAKGKEIQLCPRCKHRIEKIEGCNHMTCIVCEYQWCWLCRGAYSEYHFNPLNPFGCSNLQGGDNTRERWPLHRIYLRRIGSFCL